MPKESKPAARKVLIREVSAPSLVEALQHVDELNRSWYDMYVLEVYPSPSRDGYIQVKLCSWENNETREIYSC